MRAFCRICLVAVAFVLLFFVPSLLSAQSVLDLMLRGQRLNFQGRHEEAVPLLKQALGLNPDHLFARSQLALAYAKLERRGEAVTEFREILRRDPEDFFARTWIGILTERPLEKKPEAPRELSPLQRAAIEEERLLLSRLEGGEGLLRLQINRVVIDAGHGGQDAGAVGPSGYAEKEATLDISRRLKALLDSRTNVKSFLTRDGDYFLPLSERTTVANQYRADIFMNIHINSNENRAAHGTQTFFASEKASSAEAARVASKENAIAKEEEEFQQRPNFIDIENILFQFERKLYWSDSSEFAETIQDGTGAQLGLKDRGVASANFFVLRDARMPSILVEVAFISNEQEERLLRQPSFRQKVAETLLSQIQGYRRVSQQ